MVGAENPRTGSPESSRKAFPAVAKFSYRSNPSNMLMAQEGRREKRTNLGFVRFRVMGISITKNLDEAGHELAV